MASYHLLWLDEPTNHLDMEGKRELAAALAAFDGGFILVSHDRELIELLQSLLGNPQRALAGIARC